MRKFFILILLALSLCGCRTITSLIHDDEVVAKVGEEKLFLSELRKYIPGYASPEDSVSLAHQYINSWATEQLYMQVASETLTGEEMDVTPELEDYRRSLIKFRYEQHYVNDRLDTLITPAQIEAFYKAHKEDFVLDRPILKVRFVDVMKDSPSKDAILRMMGTKQYSDSQRLDTLARSAALRYFDKSDTWMDAAVLAREFGMDYTSMLAGLKGDFIRIEPEDRGDLMAAYVCDIIRSGIAPVEYCEDRIRDMILSARKHDLIESLERDLLKDAVDRKQFVIYEK